MNIFLGIMIPFAGTALGAACVFLLKNDIRAGVQKALLGFASGIMVAASVWSLLIPAMEMSESMGKLRFIPAALGFMVGILTLLLMDSYVPHQHLGQEEAEGIKKNWSRSMKMVMAVTIHNIPEGMAVGVVFAGIAAEHTDITLAGAFALSIDLVKQEVNLALVSSDLLPAEDKTTKKGETITEEDQNEQWEKITEKYAFLGIPMIVDRSEDEKDDLAKAEWIKVYGVIFGCEEQANDLYNKAVQQAGEK